MAVHTGHVNIVSYLLSIGASVNERKKDGSSALHHVCFSPDIQHERRRIEIINLLFEYQSLPFADRKGNTPLHLASNLPHVMKYLLQKHCNSFLIESMLSIMRVRLPWSAQQSMDVLLSLNTYWRQERILQVEEE